MDPRSGHEACRAREIRKGERRGEKEERKRRRKEEAEAGTGEERGEREREEREREEREEERRGERERERERGSGGQRNIDTVVNLRCGGRRAWQGFRGARVDRRVA